MLCAAIDGMGTDVDCLSSFILREMMSAAMAVQVFQLHILILVQY